MTEFEQNISPDTRYDAPPDPSPESSASTSEEKTDNASASGEDFSADAKPDMNTDAPEQAPGVQAQSSAANPATDRKKKKAAPLSFRQKIILLLVALLFLCTSTYIIKQRIIRTINSHFTKMDDYLTTAIGSYNMGSNQQELLYNLDMDLCDFYVKMIAHFFKRKDVSQEILDQLQTDLVTDGLIYYYNSDGSILIPEGNPEPSISSTQLASLKEKGYLRVDDQLYSYASVHSGSYVIILWDSLSFNMDNLMAYEALDTGYQIRILDQDGLILQSTLEQEVGQMSSDTLTPISVNPVTRFLLRKIENLEDIRSDQNHKIYVCREQEFQIGENVYQATIQYSLDDIRNQIIPYVFRQLALMLLVYILMIKTTLFLSKQTKSILSEDKGRKVAFIWHMDTDELTHLSALHIVCLLLTLGLTIYMQLLTGYSEYYISTSNTLNEAVTRKTHFEEYYEEVEERFNSYYIESAELITYLIKLDSDIINNHSLSYIAKQFNNYFISYSEDQPAIVTIYDDSGTSVASSDGYTGYQLSASSEDEEAECLSLLSSPKQHLILNTEEDGTYKSIIAIKREDTAGILIISVTNDVFEELKSHYTLDEVLNNTGFGKATKLYVNLKKPDITHISVLNDDSYTTLSINTKLSDEILAGDYEGEHILDKAIIYEGDTLINAGVYYHNEIVSDDILFLSLMPVWTIIHDSIAGIAHQLLSYLILFILLIFFCQSVEINKGDARIHFGGLKESFSIRQSLMNNIFQKSIHQLLIATTLIILIISTIEYFFFSSEILNFLYGSKWAHHLNLFSITKILVALVAANILSLIIIKLITLISDSLGSRSATIGKMLCSLLKFGTVAFLFIYSCVQLGAKLSYLLTGAGLAGMVIGYAGQGLINDLLTGLFIVFEGKFQVGDWISVNDWRGEVVEIGVRTTTITYAGDTRIFNNSCLNTITVWGSTMSGALCFVSIDYAEDIDYVIDLIETSTGRYQEENPHIVEGPHVHGVTELGDNGITLRLWAIPDDVDNTAGVQRGILKTTKAIFAEHHVTIPFPQVVLHRGSPDDRYEEDTSDES